MYIKAGDSATHQAVQDHSVAMKVLSRSNAVYMLEDNSEPPFGCVSGEGEAGDVLYMQVAVSQGECYLQN